MTKPNPASSSPQSLDQLQQTVDDDIQKMRDAQQFRTLEEKVQDLKDRGIDPASTYDSTGDEDE